MIDQCANEVLDMFKKLNLSPEEIQNILFGKELSTKEMRAKINFTMITAKHNLSSLEVLAVANKCFEQTKKSTADSKKPEIQFYPYDVTDKNGNIHKVTAPNSNSAKMMVCRLTGRSGSWHTLSTLKAERSA